MGKDSLYWNSTDSYTNQVGDIPGAASAVLCEPLVKSTALSTGTSAVSSRVPGGD